MRKLTKDDIEITVTCLPEDEHPADHFTTDDEAETTRLVQAVLDEAEWNIWGWCVVRVQVAWRGLAADATLGCCSYKNEDDFRADGYFDDMVQEALDVLNAQVEKVAAALATLAEPPEPPTTKGS